MKTFTLLFCTLLCSFALQAQEDQGRDITVSIVNLSNNEGQVLIALHDENTFMKGRGVRDTVITSLDKAPRATFKNVPEGEYAILAMHDKNKNYRMDFDTGGMPQEDYGMSGNNMSYGPPTFDIARFTVKDEDLNFDIRF
ncbi:DUF2141 domain-containing protein [Sinomicrobium weinanense]|uniref:DUF2141 domain-containing protein n=1 Tax=Sinomicrobium weinanense TaxID=2842200 RepID=A0A926JSJ1_9FLAO|nr:DUF2141 domain-containing protein [Sinomicrobium weinanense]MBC9796579.1 DUF2141 domain-containing protein [Sinomicrobium weinanense]MBU3123563.1 DUF2141 domain-containing protein [Sinomicrobium weinanense]